jgi:hypothetical protein
MAQNPYQAPAAPVADPAQEEPTLAEGIRRDIRNGWIAGVISGTVTLAVTLISIFAAPVMGFGPWELLDVALIFGLAFGISRRSRTCAILLLIYFLISKFILLAQNPSASSAPTALVFIYFYVRAVIGTFRYKALKAGA